MTFRAIDITGYKPADLRDQPAPTLDWIELERCVIDERYQRQITAAGRRAIQRIASEWDWTHYQPILCAATTDGRFAIADGQHRAHAARVVGLNMLPAMIVPMTPLQQAAAFGAVNTSSIRLNRAAVFKAGLAAGDPLAVAAAEAVAAAGCRLMTHIPSASQRKPGDVFTHALILRMVEAGEAEAVTVGLRAVRESDQGSAGRDAYNTHLRVWDQAVLMPWLTAIAASQRFLRLPLADIFDEIDWMAEIDTARLWARQTGKPVKGIMRERVEAVLRRAQQEAAA